MFINSGVIDEKLKTVIEERARSSARNSGAIGENVLKSDRTDKAQSSGICSRPCNALRGPSILHVQQ